MSTTSRATSRATSGGMWHDGTAWAARTEWKYCVCVRMCVCSISPCDSVRFIWLRSLARVLVCQCACLCMCVLACVHASVTILAQLFISDSVSITMLTPPSSSYPITFPYHAWQPGHHQGLESVSGTIKASGEGDAAQRTTNCDLLDGHGGGYEDDG